MSVSPGTRIGVYEVETVIGAGGMGEVYRARDAKLGREVALKILPPAFGSDPDRIARFDREAQLLATLNHPNIAQVYGFEDSGSIRALVLELVGGVTLAERIAVGPFPIEEALVIARQIADALEAAHEKGVIHRDLKPANIKVREDGTVKVLDFGLAKLVDPTAGTTSRQMDVTASPTITSPVMLTGAGMILGTAAYMAPEQARGKSVDRRADIWAFGCVLYEMLAGTRPFAADDVSDTTAMILMKDPEWSRLPAHTPPSIHTLLRRCLEKDPKRRLPDIGAARLEIDDAIAAPRLDNTPVLAATRAPQRIGAAWAVAAVAAAVAVGVALVHLSEPAPAPPPVLRFSMLPEPDAPFTSGVTGMQSLAVAPDGRSIVYPVTRDAVSRLALRVLAAEQAIELPGTENVAGAFWSPDSRFLAFVANGKLQKLDVQGGPPQVLCDAPSFGGGTWSADGTILFATSVPGSGLMRVPSGGGTPTAVTTPAAERKESVHDSPWFLPDGNHFLYNATATPETSPAAGYEVYVSSLDGAAPVKVLDSDAKAIFSGGYLLFIRGSSLMAQAFDTARLTLTGDPTVIAEGLRANVNTGAGAFSASANGVLSYRVTEGSTATRLTWVDRSGKELTTVGEADDQIAIRLSPDGARVAVSVLDPARDTRDIWIHELARGGFRRRLTFDPGEDWEAVWSPDGRQIAYSSGRAGALDVYVQAADGSSAARRVLERAGNDYITSWSPDGQYLLVHNGYAGSRTGNDLWLVPAGGGEAKPLLQTGVNELVGRFSPDGRWVAFQANISGRAEILVAPAAGGDARWQISTNGGTQHAWARDGREIFYFEGNTLISVPVDGSGTSFEVGAPMKLFQARRRTQPYLGFGTSTVFDVAPDGRRFLIDMLTVNQPPPSPISVITNWTAALR